MEKLLNPDDKEYMKMAMVKHEETFREQVKIYYSSTPFQESETTWGCIY